MATHSDLSLAYVVDPRFPGGTSSAVAAELDSVRTVGRIEVHALETKMFDGRYVVPQLTAAMTRLNQDICWDSKTISADIVILHNPSCLKFQDHIGPKIFARHLIVVTHENFVRPGGASAFDVKKCLAQIEIGSIALKRSLAPISDWNRSCIEEWVSQNGIWEGWSVLSENWFNICDFEHKPPTTSPRDRRGRHSRPGPEKFPSMAVMNDCFPKTAEKNTILGADNLMSRQDTPNHWSLYPFGSLTLDQFFNEIDFLIYYTAPTWRESFGRVIAEAIAAGKMVITDAEIAQTFSGCALGASPAKVDQIIAGFLEKPETYYEQVIAAQKQLKQFSADAFRSQFESIINALPGEPK